MTHSGRSWRRRYLDLPWGQVHLREAGRFDAPLLVLLHQTPLSGATYEPVLGLLGRTMRVVALDTPGYGGSDSPPHEWSLEDYADGVWQVLDELGSRTTFLLGQHTGAILSVEATRQQPDRVQGVVLHGVPVYTDDERAQRLAEYAPPFEIHERGTHLSFIWERQRRLYPSQDPAHATECVKDYLSVGPDYGRAYRAVFNYDIASRIGDLSRKPVLLVSGEHDLVHPHQGRAQAKLPEAEFRTLEGLTDFAPHEDPRLFASVVTTFISSQSR